MKDPEHHSSMKKQKSQTWKDFETTSMQFTYFIEATWRHNDNKQRHLIKSPW